MLTFTETWKKAQVICGDFTDTTLTQLKQDINVGYHKFNASLGRYFSRKQQFTDIIEGQSIYQTPIDSVRIIGMTCTISNGSGSYKVPVKEIRSEFEWRNIIAYPYSSNWEAYYFMLGNDEFQLWPTPSQDVTNGLRFYYQQQDHSLSIEDITDTDNSSGDTVTVSITSGSNLVTATSGIFTPNMASLKFQLTGVNDLTWYEIVDVPTATTLTLKSAFVGLTGTGQSWRIGQSFIFPDEYDDTPIDYALSRFFESRNNPQRATYHQAKYQSAVDDAVEQYSSSTEGNVIADDGSYLNSWFITPLPPSS